jgi:hypothetical protein
MKLSDSFRSLALSALLASPALASAQTLATIPNLFAYAIGLINGVIVPTIIALAFLMFVYGVFKYFIQGGGNPEKVQEGQKFVMWSMIGFFVIFSIWGLVNLLVNTFGFGGASMPKIPTFNGGTGSTLGSTPGAAPNTPFGGNGAADVTTGALGNGRYVVNGTTYTNALTAANASARPPAPDGSCPFSYIKSSGKCFQPNAATMAAQITPEPAAGTGLGQGTVLDGQGCISSADCQGANVCNFSTKVCQADNNLGQQGDACQVSPDCQGSLVCDINSKTCQDPSAAGITGEGDVGGTGAGSGNGSVQPGGACNASSDCQDAGGTPYVCNVNSYTCKLDNGLGQQGDQCKVDNECDGSLVCDQNSSTCQPPNNAGVQDSQGSASCDDGSVSPTNSCVTCPNGTTSADATLCPV